MNIGFDLDKVFIDYPPFFPSKVIDRLYKKKDNGVLVYRIPSKPEQIFRKATHFPMLRPPIKYNLDFLRSIPKDKNKLYLISSRYKFLEGVTNDLVKRYELDRIFDGLYFNYENKQPHIFKNEVIKGLNLHLYVDDDLSLVNYVAKHNRNTKFLWLNYRGEDKPMEKNVESITRITELFKHK